MSREIKFRAFEKDSKKMIYPNDCRDEWDIILNKDKGLELFYIEDCQIFDAEFMQYTGLKDKNRKEIYEGDIVKQHGYTDYDNYFSVSEFVGIVIYEDCGFAVRHFDKEDKARRYITPFFMEISEYPESIKHYEVIGNIYENPELLKGSEE